MSRSKERSRFRSARSLGIAPVLMCLLALPAVASTTVPGGTLSTDTTWDLAGSPYIVTGHVVVEGTDGADGVTTLTLEPGVEVRFQTSNTLRIGGTSASSPGALIADGDGTGGPATIVFTSDSGSPAPGDWQGILYFAGARGSSLLRNVVVEYTGANTRAGVYMNHSAGTTLSLHDVTVRNGGYQGILQQRGDTIMSEVTITDVADDGIRISAGNAVLSQIAVSGSGANGLDLVSSAFTLDGCVLGSNAQHDVRIDFGVTGSVTNCSSIESVFYAADASVIWSGNTFDNWGALTSRVGAGDLGGLIENNTIHRVTGAALEVAPGTVRLDGTWTADAGSPYVWYGTIYVDGTDGADGVTTLTIEPGLEQRVQGSHALRIGGTSAGSPGALVADGDGPGGPATIVFTSHGATPSPGDWQGIQFRSGARGSSVLRDVVVEYAGANTRAAVELTHSDDTALTLDDITVRHCAYYGIYSTGRFFLADCTVESNEHYDLYFTATPQGSVTDCASIESVYYNGVGPDVTWSGNTFNNWGWRTSRVSPDDAGGLSSGTPGSPNTFNSIPGATLEVVGGTVTRDSAWSADAGPFVVIVGSDLIVQGTDGVDGRTTLTLEPGVAVKFPPNGRLLVGGASGAPGELIADGRLGGGAYETVNLNTSNSVPTTGDWTGLHVRNTGRSELYRVQVRYADTAVRADGNLGAAEDVTVNRANVGLDLVSPVVELPLSRMSFRNCDVAVRSAGADPVFRDSDLVGDSLAVENLTPATNCVDALQNWWGAEDGPSGGPPSTGCETEDPSGSGSGITDGVLFSSWHGVPADDGDSIPCDDGDGFADPCVSGQILDCDDNCCIVSNESQDDLDEDGEGDACDTNPVLRVSTDPADGADFEIVQDAVDACWESGTRIEIFPGLGPYGESVRLDRFQVYSIIGLGDGENPTILDGGAGPAFRVVNKIGTIPMEFRNLTLWGNQGIRSSVDLDIRNLTFEMVSQDALELDAGSHSLAESNLDGPAVGARVSEGALLNVTRTVMRGCTDAGLIVAGDATLENTVIGDGNGADGIRLNETGAADLRYSTIANNTGAGIDNSAGGSVTVDRSIVFDNAFDDLIGIACSEVAWTDTGVPDCSSVNSNLSLDPLLDMDFRPQADSPCLDHGPDPSSYQGEPPSDAAGGPRLLDYDGNGFAHNDCGAFEMLDDAVVPGDVQNVLWDFNFRMLWDAEPSAVEYHVYRDDLATLSYGAFGACRDDLDTGGRTDTQLDDLEEPPPGAGFFYLITAEDAGGEEGTLGYGTHAERSNFAPCP